MARPGEAYSEADLPFDLLLKTFDNLEPKHLKAASLVPSRWHAAASDLRQCQRVAAETIRSRELWPPVAFAWMWYSAAAIDHGMQAALGHKTLETPLAEHSRRAYETAGLVNISLDGELLICSNEDYSDIFQVGSKNRIWRIDEAICQSKRRGSWLAAYTRGYDTNGDYSDGLAVYNLQTKTKVYQ